MIEWSNEDDHRWKWPLMRWMIDWNALSTTGWSPDSTFPLYTYPVHRPAVIPVVPIVVLEACYGVVILCHRLWPTFRQIDETSSSLLSYCQKNTVPLSSDIFFLRKTVIDGERNKTQSDEINDRIVNVTQGYVKSRQSGYFGWLELDISCYWMKQLARWINLFSTAW